MKQGEPAKCMRSWRFAWLKGGAESARSSCCRVPPAAPSEAASRGTGAATASGVRPGCHRQRPGEPLEAGSPGRLTVPFASYRAGAGFMNGNDLYIPQCWPVPNRTCARFRNPATPLGELPASRRSLSLVPFREKPPRLSRGSILGAANSGLVGCSKSDSIVAFDRVHTLDHSPANPDKPRNPGASSSLSVCNIPAAACSCRTIPGGAVSTERCAGWLRETGSPGMSLLCCVRALMLCLVSLWRSPPPPRDVVHCPCHPEVTLRAHMVPLRQPHDRQWFTGS